MKRGKKKILYALVCVLFLAVGCEQQNARGEKSGETDLEEEINQDVKDEQNKSSKSDESEEDVKDTDFAEVLKIYYIDNDLAEIVCRDVEVDKITPENIWKNLQQEGILTEECKLNRCDVDSQNRKIDIDVDDTFGAYIRSMGTAGEEEILTCVIKSYLETYECEMIKITENGHVFETGHVMLDGYVYRENMR